MCMLLLVSLAALSQRPGPQISSNNGYPQVVNALDRSKDFGNATIPRSHSLITRKLPSQTGGETADVSTLYGKPCPPDQLKAFVDYGRLFLQAAMEADVDGANRILIKEFGVIDPFDTVLMSPVNQWQRPPRMFAGPLTLARQWHILDCSERKEFELRWPSIAPAIGTLRILVYCILRHTLQNTGYNIALEAEEAKSGAKYTNVYNILDGVTVVQSVVSSHHAMHGNSHGQAFKTNLPRIPHHSEMLWAMWERLHGEHRTRYGLNAKQGREQPGLRRDLYWDALERIVPIGGMYPQARQNIHDDDIITMKSFLNRYVVQAVEDVEMDEVIASSLHSRGWGEYEKGWSRWDHQEKFSVGHWCFYALLAQPFNRSVAFLLIQHKSPTMLRRKMLRSVSILYGKHFREDASDMLIAQRPNFAWEIVDVHQDVIDLKATFESRWVNMNSWEHFAETIPIAHPNPGFGLDLSGTGLTPGPGHGGLTPGPGDEGLIPRPYV
ncbi:hypothetical protein LTR78_010430 [Recurvomyces mirabilis]|uniref:Uncharacterized protein n=1 Tax=Recurvomyces mirabilis TaxID=574656 RepID=A0AAE0TQF7_9PEZI|nr:hypothetical protein LTR78_010430 [Recurvomyces mirabilis]KAK5150508.1 hypothetical protein LTS14_010001 [Recurvomyces mirabilis]